MVILLYPQPVHGLTLSLDNDYLYCSVIDTANGFAYFGTFTAPGRVVKIDLSTFTHVDTLILPSGEDYLRIAIIDTINGFAYFVTNTVPSWVVKIDLSTFTRVGAYEFDFPQMGIPTSAIIDPDNGFAYFTGATPGRLAKMDLSTFSLIGWILIDHPLFDWPISAIIDTSNDYAYFGTEQYPGSIARINITSWPVSSGDIDYIILPEPEGYLRLAVIDTANGFAYFGASSDSTTQPSSIVKIDLATFTRVDALTLPSGETFVHLPYQNVSTAAVIDTINGFAYFGTDTAPAKIIKIDLSTFTRVDALTLPPGEIYLQTAVIDDNGYGYFGCRSQPGVIVKIDLIQLTRVGAFGLLWDYPSLFDGRDVIPCTGSSQPHGPFNDGAKTSDVIAVVDIIISIVTGSTANAQSGRLDTEMLTWPGLEWKPDYQTQDIVSTGGPIVSILHHKYNDPILAGAWWDYDTWEIVTATGGRYSDPEGKHSYIAIIDDGGRYILLATGYTAQATRDAGTILKNYDSYSHLLQGRACVFIPNDLNGDGDFLDPGELQILENVY
jgi:hypothetical protein